MRAFDPFAVQKPNRSRYFGPWLWGLSWSTLSDLGIGYDMYRHITFFRIFRPPHFLRNVVTFMWWSPIIQFSKKLRSQKFDRVVPAWSFLVKKNSKKNKNSSKGTAISVINAYLEVLRSTHTSFVELIFHENSKVLAPGFLVKGPSL